MKIFLACLVCAALGAGLAYRINHDRYGQFPGYFGPITYDGTVTAASAHDQLAKNWSDNSPEVNLPDGDRFDFGVMAPEEKGSHQFIIKNVGTADLDLKVGASTCKCTVGSLSTNKLKPGEETEIKLEWSVKTNEDKFGQSAEVITNDPQNPAVRFEISGIVVRQISFAPDPVVLGEIAAGDPAEASVKFYSYLDEEIVPGEARFGDDVMNSFATIDVTPYTPNEDDGVHKAAKQAFQINLKLEPGMKQGPISQNIVFPFTTIPAGDGERAAFIPVNGRIVGAIGMLTNSKLIGVDGGGYIYDFGVLKSGDPMTAKMFVRLKGSEADATQLKVGETEPSENVEAVLKDPIERSGVKLFQLELKLKPGEKAIDLRGQKTVDYGHVMIESDNPRVPALKLMLKFLLPAR